MSPTNHWADDWYEVAMTLVLAGINDNLVWMLGDTAITQGTIGIRERDFTVKIEVGETFPALVGFAGGPEYGAKAARQAAMAISAESAVRLLEEVSRPGGIDFIYGWIDGGKPRLAKITSGKTLESPAAYIGSPEAFSLFQKIRHGEKDPYAPLAFKNFMCAMQGDELKVPIELSKAVHSLLDVFVSRQEHDVGGWAVPYLLTPQGAQFCSYSYSVSDPVFDQIIPGSIIDHGTPEGGGATLSVTEIPENKGMVVYWLQLPGGYVWLRENDGYISHFFKGGPTAFKKAVRDTLSLEVDLWAGDQPLGPPKRLTIMRGSDGCIDATIADHGNGLTFAVHNTATKFRHASELFLKENPSAPNGVIIEKLSDAVAEIRLPEGKASLDALGVEQLMAKLAEIRSQLRPEVRAELLGETTVAQIDPAWRTFPVLHPGIGGLTLNLRHSGYGWLSFVLPLWEARNLGQWLIDRSAPTQAVPKAAVVTPEPSEGASAESRELSDRDEPTNR